MCKDQLANLKTTTSEHLKTNPRQRHGKCVQYYTLDVSHYLRATTAYLLAALRHRFSNAEESVVIVMTPASIANVERDVRLEGEKRDIVRFVIQ